MQLTPKSPDATFSNIRVVFLDDELHSMELYDNFGQLTQLKFTELRQNLEFDPGQFEFSPPEGVEVVGDVITQ